MTKSKGLQNSIREVLNPSVAECIERICINIYKSDKFTVLGVGRRDKLPNLESLTESLFKLEENQYEVARMLRQFKRLPKTVHDKIELGHIIPYADEIAKLSRNRENAYYFLKGLHERKIRYDVSSLNCYNLTLEYSAGIIKLSKEKERVFEMLAGLKRRKLSYTMSELFENPEQALNFARQQEKMFSFIDGLTDIGYKYNYYQSSFEIYQDAKKIGALANCQEKVLPFLARLKKSGVDFGSFSVIKDHKKLIKLMRKDRQVIDFFERFKGEIDIDFELALENIKDIIKISEKTTEANSLVEAFESLDMALELSDIAYHSEEMKPMIDNYQQACKLIYALKPLKGVAYAPVVDDNIKKNSGNFVKLAKYADTIGKIVKRLKEERVYACADSFFYNAQELLPFVKKIKTDSQIEKTVKFVKDHRKEYDSSVNKKYENRIYDIAMLAKGMKRAA
jgi:hypothetical protein